MNFIVDRCCFNYCHICLWWKWLIQPQTFNVSLMMLWISKDWPLKNLMYMSRRSWKFCRKWNEILTPLCRKRWRNKQFWMGFQLQINHLIDIFNIWGRFRTTKWKIQIQLGESEFEIWTACLAGRWKNRIISPVARDVPSSDVCISRWLVCNQGEIAVLGLDCNNCCW